MRQYLDLIETVLTKGRRRESSVQGVGNTVYAGYQMKFRPTEEFPLLTVRSLQGKPWRAIIAELLWFLSGSDDVAEMHKVGVHLWDQWATPEICVRYGLWPGTVGRLYGPQWRSWFCRDGTAIDQISRLIDEIKNKPNSKRMKVTAWNPEDVESSQGVEKVFIAPCHGDFKCIVAEDVIDLCMTQRSADLPVGVPFNMASYSLLLMMLAQVTGLKAGEFTHHLQDVHIYDNQIEESKKLLALEPKKLPRVRLNPQVKDLFSFTVDDFTLEGYDPHPFFKIPVLL